MESGFREIVIPGDVLEDETISDGAKILYGKISRLAYKNGYCWASNKFLGGQKTSRTTRRYLQELVDAGYVRKVFDQGERQQEVQRKLYLCVLVKI